MDRFHRSRPRTGPNTEDKARYGPPTTNTFHDNALSTVFDPSEEENDRMQWLHELDERNKTENSKEFRLKHGLSELKDVANALELPGYTHRRAARIYRQATEEGLLRGHSYEAVSAASIRIACLNSRVPRKIEEIVSVSQVNRADVMNAFKRLSTGLDIGYMAFKPKDFVASIVSRVGASSQVRRKAHDIVVVYENRGCHAGKDPAGIAAGAVCVVTQDLNDEEKVTKRQAADAASVCVTTIRNRMKEFDSVRYE